MTTVSGTVEFHWLPTALPGTSLSCDSHTDTQDLKREVLYDYDLFRVAVICHQGQTDNDHYVNYARFEDERRCFDDEK
jgi:ubiquitin C-terminal hydrolase